MPSPRPFLRTASISKAQIPDPSVEPLRRLAEANLALPECSEGPVLVLSYGPGNCLGPSVAEALRAALQRALGSMGNSSAGSLARDAIVRHRCETGGKGERGGRDGGDLFAVWRKPYGNPRLVQVPPEARPTVETNVTVFLPAEGIERLRRELAPVFEEAGAPWVHLQTGDARSLHVESKGEALVGSGEVSLEIVADVRVLRFETTLFEEKAHVTDRLVLENDDDRSAREKAWAREFWPHLELPPPRRPALQCETQLEVEREFDAVRLAAGIFLAPVFGPGIAGGVDWWTSENLDGALAGGKIAGPLCAVAKALGEPQLTDLAVASLSFVSAAANANGIRLRGSLSLAPPEPAVWLSRVPVPLLPPVPPSLVPRAPLGIWLSAQTRDLKNPTVTWTVSTGLDVAAAEAPAICGNAAGAASCGATCLKCVLPFDGRVDVSALAIGERIGAHPNASVATYARNAGAETYCAAGNCRTVPPP